MSLTKFIVFVILKTLCNLIFEQFHLLAKNCSFTQNKEKQETCPYLYLCPSFKIFWCKNGSFTRYEMRLLKEKHKFDENEVAEFYVGFSDWYT